MHLQENLAYIYQVLNPCYRTCFLYTIKNYMSVLHVADFILNLVVQRDWFGITFNLVGCIQLIFSF